MLDNSHTLAFRYYNNVIDISYARFAENCQHNILSSLFANTNGQIAISPSSRAFLMIPAKSYKDIRAPSNMRASSYEVELSL